MNPVYAVVLLLVSSAARAQEASHLLVGVDSQTPTSKVAVVQVNEFNSRPNSFHCLITRLSSGSATTGLLTGEPILILLKPGRYQVSYSLSDVRRAGFGTRDQEFAGGKTYNLHCQGKTYNQMKIVVKAGKENP